MILTLPATPAAVLDRAIRPALAEIHISHRGPRIASLLLAIAIQESGLRTRLQKPGGQAHGLWQCQQDFCADILANPRSSAAAHELHDHRGIPSTPEAAYAALLTDDVFAAGYARLGLWCDIAPLPELGDRAAAWAYYLTNWRPGKPDWGRWIGAYSEAMDAVGLEDLA